MYSESTAYPISGASTEESSPRMSWTVPMGVLVESNETRYVPYPLRACSARKRFSISSFAAEGLVMEVGLPPSMVMNSGVFQRETRKEQ